MKQRSADAAVTFPYAPRHSNKLLTRSILFKAHSHGREGRRGVDEKRRHERCASGCVRACVCACVGACMRAWVRASVRGCVRERARVCALPLSACVWCLHVRVHGARVVGVVRACCRERVGGRACAWSRAWSEAPRERPANLEPLQQRGGELAEAAGAGFIEDGPHERELLRALLVEPTLNKKVKHDLHPFGVRLAEHSAVESGSVLPLHQHRIEAEQQ